MNRISAVLFILSLAVSSWAADAPPPPAPAPTVADLQRDFWKYSALATAAQVNFRNSLTDLQKQMEAQRDGYGKQAEDASRKLSAACEAQKQVLDMSDYTCKDKPAEPAKDGAAK